MIQMNRQVDFLDHSEIAGDWVDVVVWVQGLAEGVLTAVVQHL